MPKNYSILDPPILLGKGDYVSFPHPREGTISYRVQDSFLANCSGGKNDAVFFELGMNDDQKDVMASASYGYPARGGIWPVYRSGDYAAATRLVNALYGVIKGQPLKPLDQSQEIKEGDRVQLTQAGLEEYRDQSDGGPGTVSNVDMSRLFCYGIAWDNGSANCYTKQQVELLPPVIGDSPATEDVASLEQDMTISSAPLSALPPTKATLAVTKADVAVANIVFHGEAITLPVGMTMDQAIDTLRRRKEYLEERVELSETFDVFPWDGAHALDIVLTKRYGWTPAEAIEGMFGKEPPRMIQIEVGPDEVVSVPWGQFSIPGVVGKLNTGASQKGGRFVFAMQATILRKDEETLKDLFREVREFLKMGSIYRGKAIKLRFKDDDGDNLRMPEPKFLRTDDVNPEAIIFNDETQAAIQTNLFTPIQRVADCVANGIPVKRGILLGGTFGTGKTLAAKVASRYATEAGVTYVYVPRADELAQAIEFARQYHDPACVVFCEDIDRVMNGERSVAMDDILNIIDGIDTKTSNILVVLTTNVLENINPAMLRPGRLDAVIEIPAPDAVAVQKLIRLYGGEAILPDTDLARAGAAMAGNIPAVIAEMVKRAKLAELAHTAAGQPVTHLSENSLLEAAHTMQTQLRLLAENGQPPIALPTLDAALGHMVRKAMDDVLLDRELYKQVNEIHSSVR
jgi:transitional endoplasmic reticulum ATPase